MKLFMLSGTTSIGRGALWTVVKSMKLKCTRNVVIYTLGRLNSRLRLNYIREELSLERKGGRSEPTEARP